MRVVFRQLSGAVALSVAALAWAALDASPAGARDNDAAEDVRPVLECVSLNGDGAYTAVFGTDNRGRSTENLPVGSGNNVSPSPANRGQPTRIPAGRSVGSFTVGFPASGTVTWNLAGRSATATRQFARRQLSWFRRDDRITWLPADAPDLRDRALSVLAG